MMSLKTYQGRTMSEALSRVKKDLGPDAVILHTRTLRRGGVMGVGGKTIVEITASADARATTARETAAAQTGAAKAAPVPAQAVARAYGGVDIAASDGRSAQKIAAGKVTAGPNRLDTLDRGLRMSPAVASMNADIAEFDLPMPPDVRTDVAIEVDPGIRAEIEEIRALVRNLVERSDRSMFPEAPRALVAFYSHLISQDVEEQLARELLHRAARNLGAREGVRIADEVVRMELRRLVIDMLPKPAPLAMAPAGRPTVVALVGPTGVGKTTTIAKLAANMKLRERKSVGLITIDSYRIAAVEQLRTYADILKVPLVTVLTPGDLRNAIDRMSNMDLILIDTAGRSQKDGARIAELHGFMRAARPDQVHLVVSSTSRDRTTREAIERFRPLGVTQLIFTKIDEAVGLGTILNTLKRVDLQVSYLTNGQAVPDDIEVASTGRLARLILGDDARDFAPRAVIASNRQGVVA